MSRTLRWQKLISRREFVRGTLMGLGVYGLGMNLPVWAQQDLLRSLSSAVTDAMAPSFGLQAPDQNGMMLPPGFTSKRIAHSGESPSDNSPHVWHSAPDGGAVFPLSDGGWAYVSNSEVPMNGGASAIRFDAEGRVTDSYAILTDTQWNCGGGATPWGTWLSCEEFEFGRVWECDPLGSFIAKPMDALGVFKHEAVAVDTETLQIYMTEDQPDGLLYRYSPTELLQDGLPDLERGLLEAAIVTDGQVEWRAVPRPLQGEFDPCRKQVPGATPFNGGEGAVFQDGVLFFATKGDNRVWAYNARTQIIGTLYDPQAAGSPLVGPPVLSGVDNLVVMPGGQIGVAEDGGNMELVMLTMDGVPKPILRLSGHGQSEIAGPAFSPDGTRLYLSSQRGAAGDNNDGMTFEITGPFKDL